MKRRNLLIVLLTLVTISQLSFAQGQSKRFKMEGINPETITINQTFTSETEIFPFDKNVNKIFGVAVRADIVFNSDKSVVRLLFVDKNYEEHLIYEAYPLLEPTEKFSVEEISEETVLLNGLKANSVKIEVVDAQITIKSLTYTKALGQGVYSEKIVKEKKQAQNEEKIIKINKRLKEKGMNWVAGPTEVSELTYAERKQLYGQSTFPAGFEYYAGGIISSSAGENQLKSASAASPYVNEWDWRDRHGKNWITPVTNQGICGACWAFAATGATEAMVNVFFNQQLNLNLSEQDVLSCSGGGSCDGGYPTTALNYISQTGVVDENTFPYSSSDQSCKDKGNSPTELIKTGGRIDFGSSAYPKTEDDLKRMLIEMGPVSGGLYDWSHAMVLVGYKVVKEGDIFYYRDLKLSKYWETVVAGDPLIGKTVWIFKNSWGSLWGDEGYVYVETSISNFGWTSAIKTPVTSMVQNYQVICEDRDGDGYYWWGLGPKPSTCNCPNEPDGNDTDPTLGPLDQYGNCKILTNLPVADFATSKTEIMATESVQFNDLSSLNTTSWTWSFEGGFPASSNEKNPVVIYNSQGSYNAVLTVTNEFGSNTKTVPINVNEYIPHYCESNGYADKEWIESVKFGTQTNISGSSGTKGYQDFTNYTFSFSAGSKVDFTLTPKFATNAVGQIWVMWIDYDGDKAFNNTNERVYISLQNSGTVNGSFYLPSQVNNISTRLRISMKERIMPSQCETFSSGEVEDYTIKIGTPTLQPPVANLSANKTTVNTGESVNFTDLTTNNPTSWSWSFSGGTPSTSTAQNPAVNYATEGTYNVTLTATNSAGSNLITKTGYITVSEAAIIPVANFAANNTTINAGQTVTFTDLSTNSPTSWSWIFIGGSPGSSNSKNPVITYNSPGTYTVSLTVTNEGGSNTRTAAGYITVNTIPQPPVADFEAEKTNLKPGENVLFNDLSLNEPTSWQWSFPGGTPASSNAEKPTVTYQLPGEYDVTLVVSKDGFTPSQKIKTKYIIATENILPGYCIPVALNSSSDYIQNITIGSVLNVSSSGKGYSLSTNEVLMAAGKKYDVSLTPYVSKNREYWRIWIDLNGDGDFDDSDETLVSLNNKRGTYSTSFIIPSYASGSTRMRIAMKAAGSMVPCDDNYMGEVEDYDVIFQPAASFMMTTALKDDQNIDQEGFKFYPNPVIQLLNIQLDSAGPNDFYTIYSMNGEKLVSKEITSSITTIDFAGYSPGIYILKVVNENKIFYEKVIKNNN